MNLIRLVIPLAMCLPLLGCATKTSEHKDIVTMRGQSVTLVGSRPQVGQRAPAFNAVANDMSTYKFHPGDGRVSILASVPSLDTPVCSSETRHFNREAASLGPDVSVLTISMNLPFAQKRWCGAEGIEGVKTVSDYRDRQFQRAYGVRVKETGLLARTVFVVDRQGRIAYEQIVPELSHEPDYGPVLAAARRAANPQS